MAQVWQLIVMALAAKRCCCQRDGFPPDIADAMAGKQFGVAPTSLILLLGLILVVWLPVRRSVTRRAVLDIGTFQSAASTSGVPINRARFAAYVVAGLFAAIAGLFLTCLTCSGEATIANGNTYTLYAIGVVVLVTVSLFGGRGSAFGVVCGALAFRTIGNLLFVFDIDPQWQPLLQGRIFLVAVALGFARESQVRNRLDLFG